MSSSSSPEFDSVKAEKADAIRRYNRNRSFNFCFHRLITALALLCSFPFFPLLKQIFSAYLNRQIYVFLLINAMIFIIYQFSNAAINGAESQPQPDLHDQYVSFSASSALKERKSAVSPAVEVQLPEEEKICDKQIVVCEINSKSAPEEEISNSNYSNSIQDLTETEGNSNTVTVTDDEEIRFRRTQSEKFTAVRKKTRVLRRSETENGREVVLAGGGGDSAAAARKSMEDMNSDEFRFTIERFIASKKKVLRDENFAVLEERDE